VKKRRFFFKKELTKTFQRKGEGLVKMKIVYQKP